MGEAAHHTITKLLDQIAEGDDQARNDLMPLVYDELREVASAYFRQERASHTLQPTALVHEAYLKVVSDSGAAFQGRNHFFAVAARAMRQILVDHARSKGRQKRGGGNQPLPLGSDVPTPTELSIPDVVAIDEALSRLEALDERKARLVELRFFAGLTSDEAAEALGIARSTAAEDWRFAKAWLRHDLSGEDS